MFRLVLCWVLITRHKNLKKKTSRTDQVHKISAPKSRWLDFLLTKMLYVKGSYLLDAQNGTVTMYVKCPLMLWSQIKLTSYDFSDVHITGEFDNRPGTVRFLRIFSCVVTYRTCTVRRLYMKTSAGARRCRTVPCRRCKRSAGHRTVPGRFYTNLYVRWWIHFYQNSPLFLKRNRLLK